MSRSKRRILPELERVQAARRKAKASLAVRQGAALGADAREQLAPLTDDAPASAADDRVFTFDLPDLTRTFDWSSMMNSYQAVWTPSSHIFSFPSLSLEMAPTTPTLDAAKLDALKVAEPYRVPARVPDMVQCLTGWRGWELSTAGRLEALGSSTAWPARRPMEAGCRAGARHFAPHWDCQCGVWAFKDLDRLVAAIGPKYRKTCVIGPVSLWGRVIETENGYRAQYAYPSELWLLDSSLEELGLIYDVPVRMVRA